MSLKRSFDILFSLIGLLIFSWVIIINWLIAAIETKSNGFFIQKRVGKGGSLFTLIKIKIISRGVYYE